MVYNNQEVFKMTYFGHLSVIFLMLWKVATRGFYLQLVSVPGLACSLFNK
jgi:hypothetical protein